MHLEMSVSDFGSGASMVLKNYQNFIEMTLNMIYIVALGVGFKSQHKIHLNTQCLLGIDSPALQFHEIFQKLSKCSIDQHFRKITFHIALGYNHSEHLSSSLEKYQKHQRHQNQTWVHLIHHYIQIPDLFESNPPQA